MLTFEPYWIVSWIVSNTVIAGLIALFALAADRWFRRPALSHVLWMLVLIKLLTPPIVTLPIAIDASQLNWIAGYEWSSAELADKADANRLSLVGSAVARHPFSTASGTFLALLGIWMVGSCALAVWVKRSTGRLHRLILDCGRPSDVATAEVKELNEQRESIEHNPPRVWLIDAVVSPMLVGTGHRAKIVFPESLWNHLDDESRRLLLAHELEHWYRRDSLVRYLEAIAWIVLWWHPLVWIARSRIEECEERCCDLAASGRCEQSPRRYAEAILVTLDFLSEPATWQTQLSRRPMASTIGRVPQIEQRLREIMSNTSRGHIGRSSWIVIVLVLFALPLHPALVMSQKVTQPVQSSVVMGSESNIDVDQR